MPRVGGEGEVMYETIDGIPCDGNGRMWEREVDRAMAEPIVITEDRVETLTKRITELEAALSALVIMCPEEGDLRIMMISLSRQAMTNANLIYVTAYGQRLADARKALGGK